jgi:hypothetical protein
MTNRNGAATMTLMTAPDAEGVIQLRTYSNSDGSTYGIDKLIKDKRIKGSYGQKRRAGLPITLRGVIDAENDHARLGTTLC